MRVEAEERPKPRYATMRRCGQINFNERDPLSMGAAKSYVEWGEQVYNSSQMTGIAAEQISGLQFAVKQAWKII